MSDDERRVLVCVLVHELPKPWGPAIKRKCRSCGRKVWAALSAPKADEYVCMPCFMNEYTPDAVIEPPTPEQQREIEAYIKSKLD